MRTRQLFGAFTREYKADSLADIAAMMTYYAIFAMFPMAVFVMTVGLLVVPEATIKQGIDMLTGTMPAQAADIIRQHVMTLRSTAGGGIAVASALIALWGASRGTVALGRALNTVFDREETRPWWKIQLSAVGMTLIAAALMVVALGLLAAGPAAGRFIAKHFGMGDAFTVAWTIGRWVVAAVLVMLTWALLYSLVPDAHQPVRVFSLGTVLGVVVWIGASLLFVLYVNNIGQYEKTYGALGAVVIFITWLWISNLALLIGAEVNYVVDKYGDVPRRRRVIAEPTVTPPPEPHPV